MMTIDLVVRYIHFIAIFVLFAALFTEHVLAKPSISKAQLRQLVIVDMLYGASAVLVLLAGLALWLWVGKPAAFYTQNVLFHIKFGLFIAIALISAYPTMFYLKSQRQQNEQVQIPAKIRYVIRLQLLLLLIIPLLAVCMAAGIGL